jgi:hypothetical protein
MSPKPPTDWRVASIRAKELMDFQNVVDSVTRNFHNEQGSLSVPRRHNASVHARQLTQLEALGRRSLLQ